MPDLKQPKKSPRKRQIILTALLSIITLVIGVFNDIDAVE